MAEEVIAMARFFEELPAPPRPVLTAEQKYARRRRFAVVLNWFVLGYSVVHKLILPLYVNAAHSTSFALLDWWWLYHVALGFLLLRKKWDDVLLRAALFFGIGGASCQIVASLRERNWHSVSLWVTSAATLWVVLFLLSTVRWRFPETWKLKKAALQAFALALGFLVQFALFGFTLTVEHGARSAARTATPVERLPALSDPNACGSRGFSLPVISGEVRPPMLGVLNDVAVKNCGFQAAMARFDPAHALTVRNDTPGYLNVDLYVPSEGRWRKLQNMPLPPGLTHELPPAAFAGRPVLLMASDADPKKGVLLLVSEPSALSSLAPIDPAKNSLQIDRSGLTAF